MGLLFLVLACIVAIVLPCMIVASSRSVADRTAGRATSEEERLKKTAISRPWPRL